MLGRLSFHEPGPGVWKAESRPATGLAIFLAAIRVPLPRDYLQHPHAEGRLQKRGLPLYPNGNLERSRLVDFVA